MKLAIVKDYMSDKYNFLLAGEIALIVLYPMAEALDTSFPIIHALFLAVLIPGLWAVIPSRIFLYPALLAIVSFGLHILACLGFLWTPIEQHIEVLRFILNITFCVIIIVCLVRKISMRKTITTDI